jgi:hypothetical protein
VLFAAAIYEATSKFGLNPKLMIEIVSFVCDDPEFNVPGIYLAALATPLDAKVLQTINIQVGKFISSYFITRFWPKSGEDYGRL